MTTIVWFRQDLRVADNPALMEAANLGKPVIPVFIYDSASEENWGDGAASKWWLHQSLAALEKQLHGYASRLVIRQGDSLEVLRQLVREANAQAVCWNRCYEPYSIKRDSKIKQALREEGVTASSFNASLLFEPWTVQSASGTPYRVFTPYYKKCRSMAAPPYPKSAPVALETPSGWPKSIDLGDLALDPKAAWTDGIRAEWDPGYEGASRTMDTFLDHIQEYPVGRNRPDLRATSRLSPYLRYGLISAREVWHAVTEHAESTSVSGLIECAETYLRELIWREFAYHLLYHFPSTTEKPLRAEFELFPWLQQNNTAWLAWKRGATGFPLVDAGMRELWSIGWMHNRVRMVVASFLVKDLLIPWQRGSRWFWDTLIDADLANNSLGWQWAAGSGADAAPYFRVFNPVLQGEKFDPFGSYVRKWIPELSRLPDKWIHKPWQAPDKVLREAGISLGSNYPGPIVDHAVARARALKAYETVKSAQRRSILI